MASVILSHVYKRYSQSVVAVQDLSLEVRDREFMVLVGPSGCGKTTALRMIAGLEEISEGEISIDGRVVNNVEPRDRDIAMVFQNYALYPHMSVFENMAFGLQLRKIPKAEIEQRVNAVAKLLDLVTLLKRKPGALSGGQRQRVALGRAIVREPKVFLMDEPLSNLDAKLRVQTRAELIKLHRRLGITTIYVTHDQIEAMTMGDRMAVMKDGVLQQCDTPLAVYNRPANMFVAGFIGTPSMNFIPSTLQKPSEEFVADAGDFQLPITTKQTELSSFIGKSVTVGVRPSDLSHSRRSDNAQIEGRVEVVEPMGDVSTVYLLAGKHQLVATVNGNTPISEGDTLAISIDPARLHLFDPETEQVIL